MNSLSTDGGGPGGDEPTNVAYPLEILVERKETNEIVVDQSMNIFLVDTLHLSFSFSQ